MSDFPVMVYEPEPEPEVDIPEVANALDLLRSIYSSPAQPLSRRMRAAIAALPFENPKLAVIASMDAPTNFAAKLEATIARSRGLAIEHERRG